MKKILFTIAIIAALTSSAFAAGVPAAPFSFKPSNNVLIFYLTDGTGGTATAQNYLINSVHKSGDREYSSTNQTSNIMYKTVSVGQTAITDDSITAGMSVYPSGWSSQ